MFRRSIPFFKSQARRIIKKGSNQTNDKSTIINDYMIILNGMPIECNKDFIKSNFYQLYATRDTSDDFSQDENKLIIQIDKGDAFYEVTKCIFQGTNYEITNDNFDYLLQLSQKIHYSPLQTKLNSFCYKRECNDNQIDQHPSIQFLIELSSLINKLSLTNYEDISSQIKQKLIFSSKNSAVNKDTDQKSSKKKSKKRKKKSTEEDDEDEPNNKEIKEVNEISLNKISKKTISKIFYYSIVNTLSSNFHSAEIFKEHKKKINLIIQLIKELDSKSEEENADHDENDTYLSNFINYTLKKVQNCDCFLRETYFIINSLVLNELLTIDKLQEIMNNSLPEYFLHFYPQKMIRKYFKNNFNLLDDDSKKRESNYKRIRKGIEETGQRNNPFEDKIKLYLQDHQKKIEQGFSFDDELINIIINDDLDQFKSYLLKEVNKANIKNRKNKTNTDENTIINEYSFPYVISKYSCISVLNQCSMLELAAFFGSVKIFNYMNIKRMKSEIHESSNLLSFMIIGENTKIIEIYLNSFIELNNNKNDKKEEEEKVEKETKEDSEDQSNSSSNSNSDFDSDIQSESDDNDDDDDETLSNSYLRQMMKKINKMILLSIDFGSYDSYKFLNEYALNINDEELSFIIDCEDLDKYMKRCVSRGYFDMVQLLLKEGANTNVLLNLFCKNNNEIGIEYMLEFSNIDINTPYNNLTPLEYCINNKNYRTSLLLLHNDKIDLQNFLKVDYPKWDTRTPPVFTIFQSGLSKVVDYFLHENLFDINTKTPEGFHAIHLVCQSGDFEMVSAIVDEMKKKVKINGKVTKGQYKGFTPLHFACLSGNPQIVTLLLDKYRSNIKINLKDATKKWTPLQYAVFSGHSEIVSILLDQKDIETDTVTEEKETLLHLACMSNKKEIVDMLINVKDISTKFDLNERTLNERTPLQIALFNGNCNMISILLNIEQKSSKKKKKQSDIDPNMLTNNGHAPLIIACEMKRVDIFKLLLQHSKIDVNIKLLSTGKTALYTACELNLTEIIELLLNCKDIDVNASTKLGKTPLIAACEKGNKEAVELLIKYNDSRSVKNNRKTKNNLINFDAKTTDGKTALLVSCEYLKMDIAEMLIHIDGIECDIESDDGKTPLCYACLNNFENLVSDLIDHGANVNHRTKNNQTPLYFACLSQNDNIVKSILSRIDDLSQINLKETVNETTPLFVSCQKGNLKIFNLLINKLDEGTDLNYQDVNGKTLLFASCEGENTEIVHELLTKFNIDPNIPDESGKNALHVACEKKNVEIVNLIIQNSSHEININEKWNDATPLEIACEKGSIEIVRILLKQEGILVNPTDKHEVPPLLCACEIWRADIIKLLLTEVEDIDVDVLQSDRRSALHYSCEKGDAEITSMILSKSAKNINMKTTDKMTPIELACNDGNADVISLLLNHIDEIEINAKFYNGNTILTEACNSENVSIVKYLLENTIIDVNGANNQSKTALHIVANNGNTKICQLLLNHEKIDINMTADGKTALYEACKCGNEGIVELLIKKGANVNCLTKNGKTPLHTACQNGQNKVVSLLLNCPEIDVNLLTKPVHEYKTAYTPLLLACLDDYSYNGNRLLCVELLLHHPKIDVNIKSSENESPLTIACDNQNFDIVNTLLQSPQIDPNVRGTYDNTVLHIACEYNKIHLIETLLNNPQINVNCMNVNNETPISIACNRNNIEMIKLLLKHEDLIVCNPKQENPIRNVIKKNKKEIFTILLNHPTFDINCVDVNDVTPLCYSIESQNIDFILQLLLLSTTDVNKKSLTKNLNLRGNDYYYYGSSDKPLKYLTPLSLSVKIGNYQIVKMLIQSPFLDINEYSFGKTALHASIISDNLKITSLLLSSPKTDPNLITKLDLASVDLQNEYHVRFLLKDSYLMGQNALHIACQKHDIESIKLLLKREDLLVNEYTSIEDSPLAADYNNKYKNECNALYIACNENLPEVVSLLLLRSDIDINATSTEDKLTPLHIAAKKGYLDIVEILLSDERCNANATSLDGTDILIFACQSENKKLLKMILSIDPEALFTSQTLNGDTPFHFACKTENPKILKILLDEIKDREFDINIKNKKGETPLHFAVKYDVEIDLYKKLKPKKINEYQYINDYLTKTVFGILIQNGADINASNLYGQTPLHYACMNESYSIIEILLRNPKTLIEDFDHKVLETPLVTLVSNTLKSNYKKYNDTYRMSVNYRLISTVNNFLDHGSKYDFIDENGISLLHFAIICQDFDLFNFFFTKIEKDLVKFLNVNSIYGTPIHLAIENWNQRIMQLLLQKKKEISFDEEDKNIIVYQCSLNYDEKSMILLLLDNENDPNLDFNVNYIDSDKRTPLHISVKNGNSIMSNILANYDKTDTNLLDKKGKSALHQACSNNSNYTALAILTKIELINLKRMFDADNKFDCNKFNKYLSSQILSSSTINEKIDINLQTKGMTRREFFRKERAKVLQQYPNTTYFNIYYREPRFNIGFTALHISVACHLADVLQKILLYPDLDVNLASEHGDTASSISAKHWNEEIVEILLKCSKINFNYVPKEEESDSEYDENGNLKDKDQKDEDDQNRPPHTLTSEEIQKIKERKRNQNKTILHSACEHNSIKIIKQLLTMCKDSIFDINGKDSFDEMAPLHYICQNGNEQILNLFIEFEKNNPSIIDWNIKNKNGMTPLHFAVRNKRTKIVDILINNEIVCPHIDINATATGEFEDGRTPLSFACEKGLLDIVNLLLSDKSNSNEDENDPFSFKKNDEPKVVRGSLCDAKSECDLTIKSKAAHQKGMTALHYACCGSNIEVVKLILNHGGFNINARANGKTCLFLACQHNREEIVKLLLDQKDIDYNLKTPRGMTPLMIASQDGRTKIVEMLLNLRKIDTKALTVDGESARSMAKNSSILNLFDKYA